MVNEIPEELRRDNGESVFHWLVTHASEMSDSEMTDPFKTFSTKRHESFDAEKGRSLSLRIQGMENSCGTVFTWLDALVVYAFFPSFFCA